MPENHYGDVDDETRRALDRVFEDASRHRPPRNSLPRYGWTALSNHGGGAFLFLHDVLWGGALEVRRHDGEWFWGWTADAQPDSALSGHVA